jgi:branched-chain amino acid transport system substrate-binding protein
MQGLRHGLADRAEAMLVASASYEFNDPTVASQIIALHGSGADTFFNFAPQKAAAQAIRKITTSDGARGISSIRLGQGQ